MAIVNLTCENDADFYRAFTYQTAALTPIDLTGATFAMDVRRHAEDATVFLQLSTATGEITITEAPNGVFTILITKEKLLALTPGDYDQSLIMTQNGIRVRVWSGTLTNNWGPTR